MYKKALFAVTTLGLAFSAHAASSSSNLCSTGGGIKICVNAEVHGSSVFLNWSKTGVPEKIEIYRDSDTNPSGREKISTITKTISKANYIDNTPLEGKTNYYWVKYRSKGTWYESAVISADLSTSDMPKTSTMAVGSKCTSSKGTVKLSKTKVVDGTFDGGCKTYMPTWGNCGQGEGQDPVFRVNGGKLKNVIIGNRGDGVHIYGDATIENVTWPDVCEDGLTIKKSAKVKIKNITASKAADKFIQLNAKATVEVSNAKINDVLKVFRENGGKCYPIKVSLKNSQLTKVREAIFRTDCSKSTFKMSNTSMSNVKAVCKGKGKCTY